jgi:hypothetical protein
MKLFIIIVISLAPQWLFASLPTTPLAEKINEYCGNNPALAYIKQHSKKVISTQMLEDYDICLKQISTTEKKNSSTANEKIHSCFIKKFKYNPTYAKTILPYIAEAKHHTGDNMATYTRCVNNIKQCGLAKCAAAKQP